MYRDTGADFDPVSAELEKYMAERYANINIATLSHLEALHAENANRFFPRGRNGNNDPCDAV
jgi:hypothetical protein